MVFASRALNDSRLWRAFALVVAFGLFALGCGKGSSGGDPRGTGRPGVPTEDEGFDTALEAKVIIVDGPPIRGAINPKAGGDEDWYTFHGVEGIAYVMQIFGYETPAPWLTSDSLAELLSGADLTGDDNLFVEIRQPTLAQLPNTTSSGGAPYDISIPFFLGEPFNDSRIFWLCPFDGEFFIRLTHERQVVGTGNYVFKISSAQIPTVSGRFKDGVRDFRQAPIFDDSDPPDLKFAGLVRGATGAAFLDLEFLIGGTVDIDFLLPIFPDMVTFLSMGVPDDEPQARTGHLHFGIPNNIFPEFSANNQPPDGPDDPHPFVIELGEFNNFRAAADGGVHTDALLPGPDGEPIRVPVTTRTQEVTTASGEKVLQGNIQIHMDAVRGVITDIEPAPDIFRIVASHDWYFDAHFTDDLDLVPEPVAVSPRNGGIYGLFETAMPMSASNVVVRQGEVPPTIEGLERGVVPFDLFYDASLQSFQIARRTYSAFTANFAALSMEATGTEPTDQQLFEAGIVATGAEPFAGLSIMVHRGGPGEVGPAFINLGTVPDPNDPLQFDPEPGFRTVIKQLDDTEAALLRDQFYNGGFYVQVTSPSAPGGLLRGEGFINLQFFPQDGTVRRAAGEPLDTGTVNFASTYTDGGSITVSVNGDTIGVLSEFVEEGDIPECGAFHTGVSLASERIPATYPYKAVAEDGTEWIGRVEIAAGSCETIILSLE